MKHISLSRANDRADNTRGEGELYYEVTALFFLATVTCTVWFAQGGLGVKGDAIIASPLILPLHRDTLSPTTSLAEFTTSWRDRSL